MENFPIEKLKYTSATISGVDGDVSLEIGIEPFELSQKQQRHPLLAVLALSSLEYLKSLQTHTYFSGTGGTVTFRARDGEAELTRTYLQRVTGSPVRKGRSLTSCPSRHSGFLPIRTAGDGLHRGRKLGQELLAGSYDSRRVSGRKPQPFDLSPMIEHKVNSANLAEVLINREMKDRTAISF
ncbi:hypothetical protein [Shewanella indica]|uniref:hypothetical protein n=1 Tax=Shewanella indica TaxID=768528 RepID=UPI001CFCCB70|nr:hypothetical protein [Shewanella indica]